MFRFLTNGLSLGKLFGIPIKITGSFFVFLGVIATVILSLGGGLTDVSAVIALISVAYAFVFLHEMGHSLVAKHLGYQVNDIRIWPLAGVASISGDWHKKPRQEFWISIAGPLVNVCIAVLLCPFMFIRNETWLYVLIYLLEVNVCLACFNLLVPVFPMDGGRIVRSFLTSFLGDSERATLWTIRFALAVCFIACPMAWHFGYYSAALLLPFMAMAGRGEYANMHKLKFLDDLRGRLDKIKERDDAIRIEMSDLFSKAPDVSCEAEVLLIRGKMSRLMEEQRDIQCELESIGSILNSLA